VYLVKLFLSCWDGGKDLLIVASFGTKFGREEDRTFFICTMLFKNDGEHSKILVIIHLSVHFCTLDIHQLIGS